ncbi:MAG: hypothetical protein Q9192_003476 [Flavoplaca navasiana]
MTDRNHDIIPRSPSDSLTELTCSRKRRAEGTPPARDQIPVNVVEEKFDEARERIRHATSDSLWGPLPAGSPIRPSGNMTGVLDETAPFIYADIPLGAWRNRCALAIHSVKGLSILGSIEETTIDYSIDATLDAGRMGIPSITIAVHVAEPLTGRPLVKRQQQDQQKQLKKSGDISQARSTQPKQASQYDSVFYHWYPTVRNSNGKLLIETFNEQSFPIWFSNADPHTQKLPSVQAIGRVKHGRYISVVTCHLRSAVFSGSDKTPIWKHLPATVARQFESLQGDVKVSIFMKSASGSRAHLDFFHRRVVQNIGILSQYYDAMTGEYTLNRIESAQPMEEVGGGISLGAKGSTIEIPILEKFINLSHFRIFSALGPIREAQQVDPNDQNPSFRRRLKAVNDFCDSEKAAVVNFRHLLMAGGKSGPSEHRPSNLCDSSPAMVASLLVLLDQLKSDLGDPNQSRFLDKLIDVKDNVIALTGPAGSGKKHVLCLAIWILLFLGRKILVCGVNETVLEDLLVQVTNAQPTWVHDKVLFRLTPSDHSSKAQIHDPGVDVLFTTLEHSASHQFEYLNFEPSVIIVCQAGKASLSSTCIPLTVFSSWDTLLLVGDWRQSGPLIPKGTKSEVSKFSRRSPIETLERFKTNTITLQLQHRMSRSIASLPARHFYGGEFELHPSSLVKGTRCKVRNVASKYYGINGKTGSEYFILDVPITQSRLEETEGSPQNYGNATAIEELVLNLNNEDIPADDIVVLCFYSSQVALLSNILKASEDGTKGCREVRTVDSYHCREAKIVIVDFVVADSVANFVLGEAIETSSKLILTDFIRDHHRINLAITRAHDGLILVGQTALFVSQTFNGGALGNTLFWMVADAMERQLVCSMEHIVDSHPRAIYGREIRGIMTDETDDDVTLVMEKYHAYVEHRLQSGRFNNKLGGNSQP